MEGEQFSCANSLQCWMDEGPEQFLHLLWYISSAAAYFMIASVMLLKNFKCCMLSAEILAA